MPATQSHRASETETGQVARLLARAAESILARLFRSPEQRASHLGDAYLACERVLRERPAEFWAAAERGALDELLTPHVRAGLTADTSAASRGGWLGAFVRADGRAVESDAPDATDLEALAVSRQALQRARSLAAAEGSPTLQRNLRWYEQRLEHRSYASIAEAEGKVPATVRTGVARARKFLLRVVHELQHAQPAPLSGDAPAEVEPLRRLWFEQDLDELARELERTREDHGDDPHWLNLAALLAADRGRHDDAVGLYERALVFADAPSVRGRVLNNLGNLVEDLDDPGAARVYWLRAHQLVPGAPAPLVNLLAAASDARDYPTAQHFIARLGELLSSGKLGDDERAYVLRRLREHPKLAWLRETDAWRLGPARWLQARPAPGASRLLVACAALLVSALALLPTSAGAYAPLELAGSGGASEVVRAAAGPLLIADGGDSMGKPRKDRAAGAGPWLLVAGDSMGFTGSPRPKRPKGRR